MRVHATVGAKENFAFVSGILLLVAWRERRRGRLDRWGWAATLAPTSLAAFVVGVLVTYLLRRPVDLYGQPIVGAEAWRVTC